MSGKAKRILIAGAGPLFNALIESLSSCFEGDIFVCHYPRVKSLLNQDFCHDGLNIQMLAFPKPTSGFNSPENQAYLRCLNIEHIVLVSWGEILSAKTFEALNCPVWNVHPSKLPAYRGPNPYFWQLYDGVAQTALTLHQVSSDIDAGSILWQSEDIPIQDDDNGWILRARVTQQIPELARTLNGLLSQAESARYEIKGQTQIETEASYQHVPTLDILRLNWESDIERLSCLLRAANPWYPVWTTCNGLCIGFKKGQLIPRKDVPALDTMKKVGGRVLSRSWKRIVVSTTSPQWDVELSSPYIMNQPLLMRAILLPFVLYKGMQCL